MVTREDEKYDEEADDGDDFIIIYRIGDKK